MQQDDFNSLLERITRVYAPPQHIDVKDEAQVLAILDTYRVACRRWLPVSAKDVDAVYAALAKDRAFWTWPSPGEVAAAFAQLDRLAHENRIGE